MNFSLAKKLCICFTAFTGFSLLFAAEDPDSFFAADFPVDSEPVLIASYSEEDLLSKLPANEPMIIAYDSQEELFLEIPDTVPELVAANPDDELFSDDDLFGGSDDDLFGGSDDESEKCERCIARSQPRCAHNGYHVLCPAWTPGLEQ